MVFEYDDCTPESIIEVTGFQLIRPEQILSFRSVSFLSLELEAALNDFKH